MEPHNLQDLVPVISNHLPGGKHSTYYSNLNSLYHNRLAITCSCFQSEKMASRPEVAAMMGLKIAPPGFYLDLEDYLGGLTFLSNELSR